MAIMLIPSIISGMEMCYFEIKEPFTPDIAMAEYIDRNIPEGENTKIYMTDSSAFTGTKFYSKKHELYDKDNKPIKYITVYLKRKIYSILKVHKGKEI